MNIGHRTLLKRCAAIACAALVFAHSAAFAEGDKTVEFDIDAQELGDALTEFGIQSGQEVYFVSAEVADIQTEGLEGVFTTTDAINRLLDDSGVDYVVDDNGTLLVGTAYAAGAGGGGDSGLGNSSTASSQMLMAQNQTSAPHNRTSRATNDDDEDEAPFRMEEILVTGSRIRGAQSASPVITITRQDIDQAGFATVEELVEKLPQNFGAGASLDTFTDFNNSSSDAVGGNVDNVAGGTSVNLRGLGASSTLILLNGRRMSPSGRSARFTNISSIPVSAIERIEVLTDGASAIYGSDAIGGVINFILRDDYDGAETRLRYGVGSGGNKPELLLAQSFGHSWDDGNVLLTYEYYDSDSLASRDRDITSTNDLSRFGGTDWRALGGNPANIFADGQFWAIPAGQDGTSLTSADFDPMAPLNRYNSFSLKDVLPKQKRHSAFIHITQVIGAAEVFAEGNFSNQDTQTRGSFEAFDMVVPESNAFFVDPTGTGLTSVFVDNYLFDADLGSNTGFQEIESSGAALGVRFELEEDWNVELGGNWSKEDSTSGNNARLDVDAINVALVSGDASLAFNPFGDGSNTNPTVLESFVDRSDRVGFDMENELSAISLNIDGKSFDIPGGSIQIAAGLEFREESLLSTNNPMTSPQTTEVSRDVIAVYSELFFPLVSQSNNWSGVERLELSLAARYEDYNDFGDSTNPKVGLLWSPTQALTLRGTYGTSFRAPALFDLDVSNLSANAAAYVGGRFVDLGLIPFPVIFRLGSNEDLQAEEATTWTVGFDWTPERIKGLSLDMTYFSIDFENRIDIPTGSIVAAVNDPRFASIFISNPTDEQIAAIVNDSRWRETFAGATTPSADVLSGAAPVGGIADVRRNNLSQSVVTGTELELSYHIDTSRGAVNIDLNGSYLFDYERRFISADPLVEEIDTLGRPIDFRARGSVSWDYLGWVVSGFVNRMDGYTDNISDPTRAIDSWTTVDLTIAYDTGDNRGVLSDTRLSLTVQNVFDEDPPFVDTTGGLAYDSINGNALGRFLALQITKDW